jgi:hypothetical protein
LSAFGVYKHDGIEMSMEVSERSTGPIAGACVCTWLMFGADISPERQPAVIGGH